MSDFRVQGKLGLDGSGFFSTLGRAEGAVGRFGTRIAGAFSVGAIVAFSKSVVDLAGKLHDVSEALNLNVEYLQRFANSAAQSGGGIGDIEKFLFESNKARQEAVNNPGGKESGAFARLGFSQSDIANLNPQQFIDKLIAAFAGGADASKLTDLAEIGGKSAKKLVGAFKDGLDKQTAIMSEDVVDQLDAVGDKFTSIGNTLKSVFAPVLVAVANGIGGLVNEFQQFQEFISTFIAEILTGSGFGEARRRALEDAEEKFDDQKLKQIQEERNRNALKAARKEAQEAPANIFANEQAKSANVSAKKIASPYSDSLLAVGNFLGGKTNGLAGIAERQLEIAAQSLTIQQQMLAALKKVNPIASLFIPQ